MHPHRFPRASSHSRASDDRKAFASNCPFFKEEKAGWFVHVFDDSQEKYFGMVGDDGKVKCEGWKPETC